jgi:hypothetical protein
MRVLGPEIGAIADRAARGNDQLSVNRYGLWGKWGQRVTMFGEYLARPSGIGCVLIDCVRRDPGLHPYVQHELQRHHPSTLCLS